MRHLPQRSCCCRKSIEPGMRQRRNQTVVYLKSRAQISEFFALTGAHHACLEWQSQSIMSGTRSAVNRLVNCDAANARRLAESSLRQRDAIGRLSSSGVLQQTRSRLDRARPRTLRKPSGITCGAGPAGRPPGVQSGRPVEDAQADLRGPARCRKQRRSRCIPFRVGRTEKAATAPFSQFAPDTRFYSTSKNVSVIIILTGGIFQKGV